MSQTHPMQGSCPAQGTPPTLWEGTQQMTTLALPFPVTMATLLRSLSLTLGGLGEGGFS